MVVFVMCSMSAMSLFSKGNRLRHYYIVVSVSNQGMRGSASGSGAGSAPVPSQRGQSISTL